MVSKLENRTVTSCFLILLVIGVMGLNLTVYKSSFVINFMPGLLYLIMSKIWKRRVTLHDIFYVFSFMILLALSTNSILSSIIYNSISKNMDVIIIVTVYAEIFIKLSFYTFKKFFTINPWVKGDYILLLFINLLVGITMKTIAFMFNMDEVGLGKFIGVIIVSVLLEVLTIVLLRKLNKE